MLALICVWQCCGSDRWGDWKPHLAVMLSNETEDCETHRRAIITMGDTLGMSLAECHNRADCPFTSTGMTFNCFTEIVFWL